MIYGTRWNRLVADRVANCLANYRMNRGGRRLVSGLWRDNQLERLMARSGDVKNQGVVPKAQKQKRERESGTNLAKMPLKGQQGSDCDHMGAHKGLARVDELRRPVARAIDYVGKHTCPMSPRARETAHIFAFGSILCWTFHQI